MSRVLVVEDSPVIADLFCKLLEEEGHEVDLAATAERAWHLLAARRPYALAVIDDRIPLRPGCRPRPFAIDVGERAASLGIAVIVHSGSDLRRECDERGWSYVPKGGSLGDAVRATLEKP